MSVQEQSFFWLSRLEELERRLDAFVDNDDDDETDQGGVLVQILRDACALVREAEASGTSDFKLIVDKAHYIINKGVLLAYGDADLFDFMPPFAYDDTAPLVADSLKMPFSTWYLVSTVVSDHIIYFKCRSRHDRCYDPIRQRHHWDGGTW